MHKRNHIKYRPSYNRTNNESRLMNSKRTNTRNSNNKVG